MAAGSHQKRTSQKPEQVTRVEMATAEEDEFKNRDTQGLQPLDGKKAEEARSAAEAKYFKMIFGVVPLLQLGLASATYAVSYYLLGYSQGLDSKFAFLRMHDLGWIGYQRQRQSRRSQSG